MSLRLISTVARTQVWALEISEAQAYFPLLKAINDGVNLEVDFNAKETIPGFVTPGSPVAFSDGSFSEPKQKSIAVIPIKSTIVKYDQSCGPRGTDTIASWIKAADQSENIAAIILDIDSGGGSADAVSYISSVIKGAKKPVIAYTGNGMAASAAYWIASNAVEIYSSFEGDSVGSIGTFVTLADWAKYYEKEGLPVHEIYATDSTEKNKLFKLALDGKYEPIRKQWLDVYNASFQNTIKANRAGKLNLEKENVLTGKLYFSNEALSAGLIDGIKSFDEVITRAWELAAEHEEKGAAQSQTTKTNMKDFPLLSALLAITAMESTKEGVHLSEANLAEIEAALVAKATADSDKAKAITDLQTANDALTTANESLTNVTAERDALQVKVAELGGKPGATSTGTYNPKGDKIDDVSTETLLANLAHNKELDDNPLFN